MENCKICEERIIFVWTDLHGEGTCSSCGTPYQIIQYGEDHKRLEGVEPRINIKEEYIPYLIEYWKETHKHMGLGTFFDNPNEEYRRAFFDWLEAKHPEAVKKPSEENTS